MKLLKTLIFLVLSAAAAAWGDGYTIYADKILELERHGHINREEAQQKVLALKLRDDAKDQALRQQARGVASAIRLRKVIKIENEAIQIIVPVHNSKSTGE